MVGLAQEKKSWEVEDSFGTKNINDLQISPDGESLGFVVSWTSLEENDGYSRIWKLSSENGELLSLTGEMSSAASPHPVTYLIIAIHP